MSFTFKTPKDKEYFEGIQEKEKEQIESERKKIQEISAFNAYIGVAKYLRSNNSDVIENFGATEEKLKEIKNAFN